MKKYKSLIFALMYVLLGITMSKTTYAKESNTYQYKQPNGTVIKYQITEVGNTHYCHDSQNYVLAKNKDNYITYAKKEDAGIVASNVIKTENSKAPTFAVNLSKIKSNNTKYSGVNPKIASDLDDNVPSGMQSRMANAIDSSVTNSIKGQSTKLIIYICFADEDPQKVFSNSNINYNNNLFSKTDGYYKAVSKNQFSVKPYTVKNGNRVFVYKDVHKRSYYANKVGSVQSDYEHPLIARALAAAKKYIPNNLNVDYDNDGKIDDLTFVVSKNSDAWSGVLWPHMWQSNRFGSIEINGASPFSYVMLTQYHGSGLVNKAIVTHETGHLLGTPDLYRYADTSQDPVSYWDLMSYADKEPQNSMSLFKYKYFGWINRSQIRKITKDGRYTISLSCVNNYMTSKPLSYLIPVGDKQYIFLEYRKQAGQDYDYGLSSGLMVGRWVDGVDGNGDAKSYSSKSPDEFFIYNHSYALSKGKSLGKTRTTTAKSFSRSVIHKTTGENSGIRVLVDSSPGADTLSVWVDIPTDRSGDSQFNKAYSKYTAKKTVKKKTAKKKVKIKISWKKRKKIKGYVLYQKKGKKYKKIKHISKKKTSIVVKKKKKYRVYVKKKKKKIKRISVKKTYIYY